MIQQHSMNRGLLTAVLAASAISTSLHADVRPSKAFGNHMVLQQEKPIRIWGSADVGEDVTISFAGKSGTTKAGSDGTWRIDLPPMKADGQTHDLSISGKNTITLKNVVLGEVWICSGQSNMEWNMQQVLNSQAEIATATDPLIRLFDVPGHVSSPDPSNDPRGSWSTLSPEAVKGFSAVGYFFGRELRKELKVPIGLVGTNWGGTRIEPWTPKVGFDAVPATKPYSDSLASFDPKTPTGKSTYENYLKSVDVWVEQQRTVLARGERPGNPPAMKVNPRHGATGIYNGMVHALTPMSARGVIWYQGESNAGDGLGYEAKKEAWIKGWRSTFEDESLSFYWVQLANFRAPEDNPAGGGWGTVRDAQRRALRLPGTGMAVTIDIGAANDIHPRNKQDVGKRLSLWALANNYGKGITCSGPLYQSMKIEGKTIRIQFDHVGNGLMAATKNGLEPASPTPGAELKRFSIQDEKGQWHWASAKIDGKDVVVWKEGVNSPKQVRFGYESNPEGINLYNKDGLPASPFTTVD